MDMLFDVLDDKSKSILWYLWWNRHAEISELRDLIGTSDFEVLHRLKEVINGKAQELLGRPIVGFEQAKVDPISGEKILFSWWFLNEDDITLTDNHKPLVDVFDERDSVTVIAEVPVPVDLACPDIQFKNGILRIKFMKLRR